ncbi:MAG: chemotaxis protein CheR [Deltaproteobacteria bacterium]|nr:MAG: chemotaxis protein CheR [Deltaproteobacteria bacterium]
MIKIAPDEFKTLSKYILDISGISLQPGKEYLIETRLASILEKTKAASFTELHRKAVQDPKKQLEKEIIDAISTNETYFFRDNAPFDLLQHKILPDLIDNRIQKSGLGRMPVPLRIWSAACSTGQEIYSIAMILKELSIVAPQYRVKLMGTDISNQAISKASYARYNKFEVSRGMDENRRRRYFYQDGDHWKLNDELRAMVSFRQINLMKPLLGLGKFDIIFCRNVMIYFTPEARQTLYKKLYDLLEDDGYLVIGATESLTNDSKWFAPQRYLRSTFYQKQNAPLPGTQSNRRTI